MKRDTASTRRMQKRKAAKVEGTTKDKMKKTEEETVERQREEDISGKEQTEVKRKYLIPMRRIKYAAASSEKQEKPSSFVEVVESMTATKLLVNPKLLLIQLNVHKTQIERAVIDQYRVAAEKKLFTWINRARRHAPLMFSPTWIDENLPTLQRSRGREEERQRGEMSELCNVSPIKTVGKEKTTEQDVLKQKYVIRIKRNKDSADSSEKQEEYTTEPKKFIEIIEMMTAKKMMVDPKILLSQLDFLTNVKQTEIECAVIGQYQIAAEKKSFTWIQQARIHARLKFSQRWITENLPTFGRRKRKEER